MKSRRWPALLLASWAILSACDAPADSSAGDDVMVAALEAEIRLVLKDFTPPHTPVVCVEIDPGEAPQSPSKEFVARLKHLAPHVVRSGECEVEPNGVVDRDTRRPAVLVAAGPVEWLQADETEIAVTLARSSTDSVRHRYRVAREGGRWTCLGQVIKMSPA